MIIREYIKTIVIWTDDKTAQKELKKTISGIGFHPVIIDTNNVQEVAKGGLVQSDFFDTMRTGIKEGEITFVFIDDSRPYPNVSPKSILQMDISNPDDVKSFIKKQANVAIRFKKRREAMKTKLSRLFYIYTLLTETGSVKMEDVFFRTKISKRTFYRDMEVIKDVCTEFRIESTPGCFWNRDYKPRSDK
jgi:hypothetical protein